MDAQQRRLGGRIPPGPSALATSSTPAMSYSQSACPVGRNIVRPQSTIVLVRDTATCWNGRFSCSPFGFIHGLPCRSTRENKRLLAWLEEAPSVVGYVDTEGTLRGGAKGCGRWAGAVESCIVPGGKVSVRALVPPHPYCAACRRVLH